MEDKVIIITNLNENIDLKKLWFYPLEQKKKVSTIGISLKTKLIPSHILLITFAFNRH